MPSQLHPQAQFVPIPPDFDLNALVENSANFDWVTRLSTEKLKEHSIQSFEALVLSVVIQNGQPLIIEGWGESLPRELFSSKWLQDNIGSKPEQVRDIPNEVYIPMTIGHYLRCMDTLTNRITSTTYRDPKRQRLYLKDIDTPEAWAAHLKEVIPESVFYLNECIEPRTGGDGSIREPNEYGQMVYGKGVAPAGDLMSSLPPDMRALNMMCYIGHEGTYTPTHREMCASLGHNIMVDASDNKKGERAGSSIWFMTETKEREVVSEYFLSMLGHDVEVEKHFAQLNAWKKAPFNVWVVEQKVGDLVLIPPLAPHQVWNRGTRTMKAAWNRTTIDTLELALHEALPRARMVCREEQYKNKAIVYYTLLKYQALLERDTVEHKMWKYGRIRQVLEDFKRLFALYSEILVSEMFSPKLPDETNVEFLEYDSNVTCSYCRGNIFNRFLTCKHCIQLGPNGEEDTYDICMDCYAMGRSCACISDLSWVEQWDWEKLVGYYDQWRGIVVQFDGFFDVMRSPQPLEIARKRYGKKPVAEVCQEQLKLRPWNDITKPVERELSLGMSDDEPDVDDGGRIKRKKGRHGRNARGKLNPIKNKTHSCHICCHHDWNWKLAFCTTCNLAYCYGVLWRAFDLMPQTVMEDKEWSCPRCLKMCSCGKCRKTAAQKPYAPKGTLLGHDTRQVADYRSVESLVDFSKTNLTWLRDENDHDPHASSRMQRLKEKAEVEKARVDTIDEKYFDEVEQTSFAAATGNDSDQRNTQHEVDHALFANRESLPAEHRLSNGEYQNDYTRTNLSVRGYEHASLHGADDGSMMVDWAENDGHYELDLYDAGNSYSQQVATYPSKLTAPEAPMDLNSVTKEAYPDPSHVGPNRMMGAGFFQQGFGADRILFDTPVEQSPAEKLQSPVSSQNPNLIFSDLLDPALRAEEPKKRKRRGLDGVEDEEDEFFTSKRQKELARTKRLKEELVGDLESTQLSNTTQRLPRRSAGKTQSYQDLGEEAVPIEDDEGPSAVSTILRRKLEKNDSDLDLAVQALSQLGAPVSNSQPTKKRGRPRKQDTPLIPRTEVLVAPKETKAPRRSAWLDRKEVGEDSDNTYPVELPPRRRRARTTSQVNPPVGIISMSDDDFEDPRPEEELDSLFGEPLDSINSDHEKSVEEFTTGKLSKADSTVRDTHTNRPSEAEQSNIQKLRSITHPKTPAVATSEPKRRGRPRKHPIIADAPSPLPLKASGSPIRTLLSLKEKMALKGKSFRIVAAKSSRTSTGPTSNSPSSTSTSTIPLRSTLGSTSMEWPAGTHGANGKLGSRSPTGLSSAILPSLHVNEEHASVVASSKPTSAAPVNKVPTVVRLMSPSPELNGHVYLAQSGYSAASTDSSSDDSDASIPAVPVASNKAQRGQSFRGRGTPNRRGSRGGRLGRPPKSRI